MNLNFRAFGSYFLKHGKGLKGKLCPNDNIQKEDEWIKDRTAEIQEKKQKLSGLRPDIDLSKAIKKISNEIPSSNRHGDIVWDTFTEYAIVCFLEKEYNKLDEDEYIAIDKSGTEIVVNITKLPNEPLTVHGKGPENKVALSFRQPIDLSNVTISGDLDCSRQKGEFKLPSFINGRLICRNCHEVISSTTGKKIPVFTEHFNIPDGVTEFICSNSCITLETLYNQDLPKTLKTIVVTASYVNRISKDLNALEFVQQFIRKFPAINIVADNDRRTSLLEIVNQAKAEKTEEKNKKTPVKTIVKAPKVLNAKTSDDLNQNDILSRVDKKLLCSKYNFTEDELKKQIRSLMKKYNEYERVSCDNNINKCIHVSNLDNLLIDLKNVLKARLQNTKKSEQKPTEEIVRQPVPENPQPQQIATKKETPVNITKYIPTSVWRDIKKSCGDNTTTIIKILQTICSVNLDITRTKDNESLQVLDEKTGICTTCNLLHKKGFLGIVQSIDNANSDDRKRIVWTYLPSDNILVCTAFFDEHMKQKIRHMYQKAETNAKKGCDANGTKIDAVSFVSSDKYYNAEDLLCELRQSELLRSLKNCEINDLIALEILQRYTKELITVLDTEIKNISQSIPNSNITGIQIIQTDTVKKLLEQKQILQDQKDISKIDRKKFCEILNYIKFKQCSDGR